MSSLSLEVCKYTLGGYMLSKDIIEETYNEVVTLVDVYFPSHPLGSLCFHLHRFLCIEKMNYLLLSSEVDWNVSSTRSGIHICLICRYSCRDCRVSLNTHGVN